MDFSHVRRNDPCPCGSGKKFKNCHMGREDQILKDRLEPDRSAIALGIQKLPPCGHEKAQEMARSLEFTSTAGRKVKIRLVDLDAYRSLLAKEKDAQPQGPGGVLINPIKTRALDPGHVYIALSPNANASTVVHQLAHAADLIEGSALPPGFGQTLAGELELPSVLLEHPLEYGQRLEELSQEFEIELDAEDEIVAFLARRQLLIPGKLIAQGKREVLVAAAEKALRFLQDHKDEINARIQNRQGYKGAAGSSNQSN
jgi:hypothetical protein